MSTSTGLHAVANSEALSSLMVIASALSGRELRIEDAGAGEPAWTDGNAIYIDSTISRQTQLMALCVQSALLAAGSLDCDLISRFRRRPAIAQRYLCVEGQRALAALSDVFPPVMRSLIEQFSTPVSHSAAESLQIALGKGAVDAPLAIFGRIDVRKLLAAAGSASAANTAGQHIPREQPERELIELSEDADQNEEDVDDFASSPVGGGGAVGKLLQRMFQMVRNLKDGGTPGADAPTHWSRTGRRTGVGAVQSTARAETVAEAFGKGKGILYPEWNVHRRCYQPDWCTVQEIDATARGNTSSSSVESLSLRKPLLQLGMGLDRFHRQSQGDDIDIDAAIEMQIEVRAGSVPDEAIYVESRRHRRDLSVLILLDISGSVSQVGPGGTSVHEQQRAVAAALTVAIHEVGDRVALYAFYSQGRGAVNLVPVKRFDDRMDSAVSSRLLGLKPGAYSRLGAAIRHAASVVIERGGTSRRLLVVLSDGLAYDHGYEPAYGAADARQALAEARRDGVGCVCLSVGGNTEADALRRVFGSAAFAAVPRPRQLAQVIGPLFRAALRAAEVQRRVA